MSTLIVPYYTSWAKTVSTLSLSYYTSWAKTVSTLIVPYYTPQGGCVPRETPASLRTCLKRVESGAKRHKRCEVWRMDEEFTALSAVVLRLFGRCIYDLSTIRLDRLLTRKRPHIEAINDVGRPPVADQRKNVWQWSQSKWLEQGVHRQFVVNDKPVGDYCG